LDDGISLVDDFGQEFLLAQLLVMLGHAKTQVLICQALSPCFYFWSTESWMMLIIIILHVLRIQIINFDPVISFLQAFDGLHNNDGQRR
jgi:hypothetical protein